MEPIETPSAAWIREFEALRALARALIADDHAAEDALQETWLRARRFDAQHRDTEGASAALRRPGAWLSTTLRNLARDRRRAESRRREVCAASDLAGSLPSPDQVAERLELTQQVIAALTALPEPNRTALHLHYLEGLTVAEIAQRAGLPLETVRTRVRRGLARMRTELDGAHGGERSAWCTALAVLAPPRGLELAPSSALPCTGGTSLLPFLGALVMSKAWIGAAGALVLIVAVLTIDLDGGAARAVRPEPANRTQTPLADATTVDGSTGIVAARVPVEVSTVVDTPGEAPTHPLVPVRGRVVIMDPLGVEHASESGQLRILVFMSESSRELRELAVEGGSFELAVPAGARVQAVDFKGELGTNVRTALLEDGPSGAFAGPDPVEVLEPLELAVRGRWTDDVLLHVSSEGADALTGVEVRRRTHWRAFSPALHPGDAPEVSTVVTGGTSPIALPDPGQGLRRVPYWVRAPGLAWRRIDIDHDTRGEHTVQLAPGGALELRVTGTVPDGELFLRLFAPGGDQGWSTQALADVTVGRDGRARLDDLQPGSYAARLDRASFDAALTLARGTVVVTVGETVWLDLAVDPAVLAPPRVRLTGTLTLPPGFTPGRHELHLDVHPRAQGQAQVRLPLAKMAKQGDRPEVLAWDAGEVLPTQYLATISELMHRELVDAHGDDPVVHLVLPPLARVSVALFDATTGESIERARLGWSDGRIEGVNHNSMAKVLRDGRSGRFVFEAPHGAIELDASATDYVRQSRELELVGDLELELRLERATGVKLSYYDGDKRLSIARDVESLAVRHPESGVSLSENLLDMRIDAREQQLFLRPGIYELDFANWPKDWEPIERIVLEVPAQGMLRARPGAAAVNERRVRALIDGRCRSDGSATTRTPVQGPATDAPTLKSAATIVRYGVGLLDLRSTVIVRVQVTWQAQHSRCVTQMNKKVLFAIGLCCLGMLAVLRDHDWSPRPGAVHPSSAAPGKGLTRAELAAQTAPRRTQPAEPPESVLAVQSTAVADDDRVDREGTAPPDVALWAGSIRWSGDAPREQELRIWRLNEGRALTARPDQRHSLRVERADVATWDVVGLQPGRYVAAIGDRFLMECTLVAGLNTTPVDEPPRTELLELQFLHRRSGGAVSPKHVWMMWDSPEYPTTVEITSVLFGGEGLSLTEPERWRGHVPRARLAILGWLVHGGFATKDIPPGAAASAETLDFDLGPILVLSVLDTHGNPATRQHRSAIDGVTLMCDGEAMEPVEVNYTKGVALLGMPPRADGAQAWELVIPEGYEAVSGADATQRLHGGHRYEFVLRELHESHRALRWRGAR